MLFEFAHEMAHRSENDPEASMLMSLGQKDMFIMALGLFLLSGQMPCLNESVVELQDRMSELLAHQNPFGGYDDGSEE